MMMHINIYKCGAYYGWLDGCVRAPITGRKQTSRNWMPPPTRRDIYSYMHICIVYDDSYTYINRQGLSSLGG